MAKTDRESALYGEPLTYDKSFKGPLAKRSCTDIICLLIFFAFLGAWAFLAYYAYTRGDLNKLLVPTDSQNRKCGVDNQVINKKYLFFFHLEACIDPIVTISGCPTPQTCVEECPNETFIFDTFKGSTQELKEKLICLDDIEKESIKNREQAKTLIENKRCARWYVKSRPFLNRCIWEFSSSVCEYIPSHLIDRSKRDVSTIPKKAYNISTNISEEDIHYRIDANLEPPFLAVTVAEPPNEISGDTFAVETFKVYNQHKLPDEPRVQCKIRQQLGEQVIMEKMKRTDTYLGRFIGNIVAHFYHGPDAQEFGQKLVEDILNSGITIFVSLIGAMVVSLIFIAIMRWIASPMVWFSIIGVLAGLGYGIYIVTMQYIYWRDNPTVPQHSPNLSAKLQTWFQDKNTWLYLDIAISIILFILLLLVVFLRDRIVIAIALVKEGSKAVGTIISTMFFPILPWVLQIATIGFAVTVGLYIASLGEPSFKVVGKLAEGCECSSEAKDYKLGGSCKPDVFNQYCFAKGSTTKKCIEAGCFFEGLQGPKIAGYLHAYNVIGFFWLMFFISAFGDMVLAATFATWYWTFHKSDVPFFTLTRAFSRTIRYHLGTLAFGSLIITICRLIRVILEFIDAQLKKYDNPFTRAILCCMKCFFWCLENFLRFLNKNAYIMCAIHGKNFCTSAKDAFNLLMRNVLRVVTVDKVTDFLFFLSKLLITAAVGAATYFYVDNYPEQYKLHYNWVPTAIVVIATYLITTVFFGVYSMAVDTLFLCFLEDSERNDGSAEKPYFMSKHLMKILGKRNEVPRHQYR